MATTPIGPAVSTEPATLPTGATLRGRTVTLTRLTSAHAADLFPLLSGDKHAPLWAYMFTGPFDSLSAFQAMIDAQAASQDPFFYAIIDNATRKAIGEASLMRIEPGHRVVEVGNIMFSPALQKTRAATEAMYLMAKHVFEDLGYRRYEWKCNELNGPSKKAAVRLGFTFEGVFRQHMVVKGHNRDTAWFAMLDVDWPQAKRGFEAWLDDENFDAEGRQIASLQECRNSAASQS